MGNDSPSLLPLRREEASRVALTVLAAGCGFCLAFGWIWFTGAFTRVISDLPEVFSGTLFSGGGISVFALSLGIGLMAGACLAVRLPARRVRLAFGALHGVAIACMAGAFAFGLPPLVSAVLLGLSASGLGICWTARLFSLPSLLAGAALAVAALFSHVLPWAFSTFGTTLLLPAGSALALGLWLAEEKLKAGNSRAATLADDAADMPARHSKEAAWAGPVSCWGALPAILPVCSFFALGVIASATPLPGRAEFPTFALGIALTAVCHAHAGGRTLVPPLLAGGAIILSALQLVFFPDWRETGRFLEGAAEGATFMGLAAWLRKEERAEGLGINRADFFRAGLCLTAVFVLGNLGGAVGAAVARSGDADVLLTGLICVGICPPALLAIAARRERRRQNAAVPAEQLDPAPGIVQVPPDALPMEKPLWSGLTPREKSVAECLILDMSNPEICAALYVSANTARTHIKNLYHKTGAASREDLKSLLRENK